MLYEPILKDHMARLLKAFQAGTGLKMGTVCRAHADDTRFYDRVIDPDCTFSVRQYDRVVCRLAAEWPENATWPNDVPRPTTRQVNAVLNKLEQSKAS